MRTGYVFDVDPPTVLFLRQFVLGPNFNRIKYLMLTQIGAVY
jgi:hypothetical protein